jgi:hypothetical protein
MLLTQKDIDELKEIYRHEFGRELADDKAWEMGERLLRLYGILAGVNSSARPHDKRVCTASGLTGPRAGP